MKQIKVNAYEYSELNEEAKFKANLWLDECPIDSEYENEKGQIIRTFEFVSDWELNDIIEHCEINEYLFNKYGECVHHLEIKESKVNND